MISVLVPVYNNEVGGLIGSVSGQLTALQVEGEIIILDDGSIESYKIKNRHVQSMPFVLYDELPANVGRLGIRKLLAEKATFPWLIFIDGDSKIIRDDFIQSYLQAIQARSDVIIGGRVYGENKPSKCNQVLHWKYGSLRENIWAGKPAFQSNNFCIKKSLFLQLKSDINWKGYGHEDTWIGMQLEEHKATVQIINNPVLHEGIEESTVFIQKSAEALHNLIVLSLRYEDVLLRKHVTLYDWYRKLQNIKMIGLVNLFVRLCRKRIEKNLVSCNPSLKLFDLYRLATFIQLKEAQPIGKN